MSRLLLIDGHPNPDSFCAAIARQYAEAASAAPSANPVEVRHLALRDLEFDPILHAGYRGAQPLEPDLVDARDELEAASHIALVSPIWWGSVPALLKGFFDRTLQARWAYHYTSRGPVGHLKGRTGRVFLTTDSPGWYLRAVAGRPTERQLVGGTLKFCGIKPVAVTRFGPVRTSTPAKRGGWLDRVAQLAAHDATRVSPTPPPPVVVTGDLPIAR